VVINSQQQRPTAGSEMVTAQRNHYSKHPEAQTENYIIQPKSLPDLMQWFSWLN